MKLLGFKEVQETLGTSREQTIYILSQKGCPTLPRSKGQPYKVFDEDLIGWLKRSNKENWK